MNKRTRYFMAGSAAIIAAGLVTGLVAFYSGGFQALSASTGPSELSYIPADAAVVAYADVASIMNSEFRQRLKSVIPLHDQKGQEEFQRQTGIDIERDVDYVVAAVSPAAGATDFAQIGPLVVARGRFNDTQLESLARQHGGTLDRYREKRLVISPKTGDGQHAACIAFLEPGLVAVGESAAVKRAIDANMSGTSITSNDEMMTMVGDMATRNNAWAVGRFDVLANHAKLPEQIARQIPPVKWFAAGGHINGGVAATLRAEARDDQSAEHLRNVVRGFLSLGQLQAQNDARVAAVTNSMQLSGSGKTVELSFTVPSEIIDAVLPKNAIPGAVPQELHELRPR
jgi:hypothetical protein